jgi:hypothetical protein
MSTLNNVFKKLEHTDKVAKVNLESQRVELALVDELKNITNIIETENSNIKKMYDDSLKTKKMFEAAYLQINEIEKIYLNNKDKNTKYNKSLQDIFKQLTTVSKDLGININEISFYKDYLATKENISNLFSENKKNWNLIYEYKK